MGTNYYLRFPDTNRCDHCGRSDKGETLHIGKSSGGWCFGLRVYPERGIYDLPDWLPLFDRGRIYNEYGDETPTADMLKTITERKSLRDTTYPNQWYRSHEEMLWNNNAEGGPNGLLRHRLGRYCAKHGEGTWDCIEGEFS